MVFLAKFSTIVENLVFKELVMKIKNTHWIYLVVVFILSYLWQLVIYFTGGVDSMLFPFTMLFPAIVAVAFRIIYKEGFRNVGWGLRKWWYAIPSVLVPLVVIVGIAALFVTLNCANLSDKHFIFRDGVL